MELSELHHTDVGVVVSWIQNSIHRKNWAFSKLNELILSKKIDACIGLLGLTYKENTHSLKNSPAIALLDKLKNWRVTAYDPAAGLVEAGKNFSRTSNALEVLNQADVLVLMTPWPEFKKIATADLLGRMKGNIIIDPYGLLQETELIENGYQYVTLGKTDKLKTN